MTDTVLQVATPHTRYPVIIESGALERLPGQLQQLGIRGAVWLIADQAVAQLYGEALQARLRDAGFRVQAYAVPSGEPSKSLAIAETLYDWLLGGSVERRDVVVALGGGVIGDLAGFVAATVLRGIGVIQLPTTLLAMVDSAVGGKTGVNHARGKNLIGAFHQPLLVLGDTDTFATLPARELHAGWAEVIKHGVIRDAALFEALEDRAGTLGSASGAMLMRDGAGLAQLIRQAVKVKVDVVNVDERETGERMLLNYGHTLGHAVEACAGYGELLHGEAVAIGMHLEAQLAGQLGMVDGAFVERQRALLHAYGLPTRVPAGLDQQRILEMTLHDKKVRAGKIRWALPYGLGSAGIRDDVPQSLVQNILSAGL